ncbi:DUF6221 family protein [Streptomyces sp. NPDC055189]
MLNSPDTGGIADSFERYDRLRRRTRAALDRALQVQSASVRVRLQAVRARAARQRLSARRNQEACRPAPPGTPPPDGTPRTVRLTALAAFVHARLDEETAAADLCHEPGCPADDPPGTRAPALCHCRRPRRIRQQIAERRNTARIAETTIRQADHTAPHWPRNEINALQDLQILAAPYELHGLWQEEWRP